MIKTIYIKNDWQLTTISTNTKVSVYIMHSPCKRLAIRICFGCNVIVPDEINEKRHTMEKIINFPV